MKKERGIVLFIITLMILTSLVSADNFLTGNSIFDKVGELFGNSIDFIKNLFAKDEVAVRNVNIRDDNFIVEPVIICNENEIRCNSGNECGGSPCVMKCQNNAWIEYSYCRESCSNGQCTESGTGLDVSSSGIGSGSGDITEEKHLECRNNACIEVSGKGENECAVNNDCIEQDIPTPTNLQYEITNQNKIILTWNNVLGSNGVIDGTGAITGYATSENNNFINKITEFIKSFFKKGPVGVLEKKYAIYKIKNVGGRNVVEKIAEINKNDCNDNLCSYEYTTPSNGDYYTVKSKINDIESSASNRVGPIHLVICGNGVIEQNEPGNECSNNEDCRRGFVCERDECRSLNCNLPLILSPDGHSCITQTTGQGQGGQPGDAGNEGERRQTEDNDNDGLPDYWEYNFFGDLSQGPNDDFDSDGISNINEYINNKNPKVADSEKSSPIWTILIIIVILGILTLAVIFAVKKIKNKSGYNFSSRGYDLDNTNKSKMQSFIQQAKSQGMKKDEIKKSLLNAGWKEEDINKFL